MANKRGGGDTVRTGLRMGLGCVLGLAVGVILLFLIGVFLAVRDWG